MDTTPIYVFAKWQVKEDQREKVVELLARLALETGKEQGNLHYKVHQSNSDKNLLILSEGYINQAAQELHKNSAHYQDIVVGQIIPFLENREVVLSSEISLARVNEPIQ